MLGLCFQVAGLRFAMDCRQLVEVVPQIDVRPLLPAVAGVRGLALWRGRSLPVLDLGVILAGAPCAERLSTRLIVARVGEACVGLLAERATDLVSFDDDGMLPPGIQVPGAPYLGPVAPQDGKLVQVLSVAELVPAEVLALLDGGARA